MERKSNKWVDYILPLFERHYPIFLTMVLAIAAVNLFLNLGGNPILDWDEARHGVTAYEMLVNDNYIRTTYDNQTDYWNLKPPLGMWLIALAYKIFGFNAFALRFFSALAAFLAVLVIALFSRKRINKAVSIMAGLVLATTYPFITGHSGRTGDLDAQLALFILLGIISLVKMEDNIKYFYLSGLFFALAFLLKSSASFQLIAVYVLYLLFTGKYRKIKLTQYVAFFIWSALPILIWGFLRYEQDRFAFFSKMISYDVIERSTRAIEGHAGGPLTYLEHLILHDFWVLYFLVGVFGVSRKGLAFKQFVFEQGERDLKIMVVLGILVPLILFSIVSSKLTWYINPIFPPLAILVGWSSYNILKDERNTGRFRAFVVFFALTVFALTEGAILHRAIFVSKPELQALLYEVKGKDFLRGRDIYAKGWSQSDFFTAKVIDGLKPKNIEDDRQYLESGNPRDLLLTKKESVDAYAERGIVTVLQGKDWVIVSKAEKDRL